MKINFKFGFTLVELAIVLVIVGLLIGGILQGQELIKQAKIQREVKNINSYGLALRAFELKYSAVPGDFSNAETYWGAANSDNGDGNSFIDSLAESIDAWDHLALAGLVSGSYNQDALTFVSGTSSPESEITSELTYRLISICRLVSCYISSWASANLYTNNVLLAGGTGTAFSSAYVGTDEIAVPTGVTNQDVSDLDLKMDDGKAISGILLAPVCTLATGKTLDSNFESEFATSFSDAYNISGDPNPNCSFYVKF